MLIITIIFIVSIILPTLVFSLSLLLFHRINLDRNKISPFECGFNPNNQTRLPFSTRFFLLAIIFIVFDIEVVLLIPFPILIATSLSFQHIIIFLLFLLILLLELIHE
ncbi:hypothetical protein HELRODRAFT_83278 [Helobdella robusta]|uniref:NADH-ubiquinone oxidoreductase chain 3 n=1 Tax=Helobdella robusta TaxID=6412 RepID=T1G532_HELRO|nr:hypothetical protein HELRODRAFT_83278 [Helobdella robusta]ESO00309.1 hypothetical protein HELRODRAFT_83278 [Helobdella robusta]